MKMINIQEAKTHLSRLVEEAAGGEEIIIAKAGKPMVSLTPYRKPKAARAGGQFGGRITEAADCWDEGDDPFEQSIARPLLDTAPPGKSARVAEEKPSLE